MRIFEYAYVIICLYSNIRICASAILRVSCVLTVSALLLTSSISSRPAHISRQVAKMRLLTVSTASNYARISKQAINFATVPVPVYSVYTMSHRIPWGPRACYGAHILIMLSYRLFYL